MIRFEVTGATPEEFAENALKQALAVLKKAEFPGGTVKPIYGSESSSTASRGDPTDADVDAVMEMQRRGGLIREKIEERKKVASDKLDDLFVEEASAKPTKIAKNSSKGPKLDDLKTRLSEVIVAATERWDQKRANLYARKLLYAVGVEKLSALEPKCYDDFMQHSEIYLDGTAPE